LHSYHNNVDKYLRSALDVYQQDFIADIGWGVVVRKMRQGKVMEATARLEQVVLADPLGLG